jgi:hypothetical protein
MSDDQNTTTETTTSEQDPFAALDADVAEMKKTTDTEQPTERNEKGQFVAKEEDAVEEVGSGWESKYKELEVVSATDKQQVQQWFSQHFPTQEKWQEFQQWSANEKTVQNTEAATEEYADMSADDEDDIFETVEKLKNSQAKAEARLNKMSERQQVEEEKYWLKKTTSEAQELGKKYPAVSTEKGREMMLSITLANIDRGMTMEQAAKQIQEMVGNTPQGLVSTPPTAIPKGKGASTGTPKESDPREEDWFSGGMSAFDMIARDTKKEFGITH